ncbi:hypothetical protein HYDPIDRAFT_158845 [Hydnomerulius pinastri MD-312]|uniref:G domain-containing protein n=1 Tax=Hydnomerulius pinastri MD-312 TaxID=994086 RepID=A0A0C9W5C8_9AGAM|nr:hypothetical protein HYDPIDRAFT_158845 [Hydnomerulius pinastri MD-312]
MSLAPSNGVSMSSNNTTTLKNDSEVRGDTADDKGVQAVSQEERRSMEVNQNTSTQNDEWTPVDLHQVTPSVPQDAPRAVPTSVNPTASPSILVDQGSSPASSYKSTLDKVSNTKSVTNDTTSSGIPNIVIFGESGVGKSSVINLITGGPLAKTSNDALGCTFRHDRHEVTLKGTKYCLWDTAGLDEGTEGTVPAAQAESNLKEFFRQMSRSGGISLLIYCIRPARVKKALLRNYEIFYAAICRKKVPLALVVTGLEDQAPSMESWWLENEKVLLRYGMRFDAHACITTLNAKDAAVQERRTQSQQSLRDLIAEYCHSPPWKVDESFISLTLPKVRGLLRSASPPDKKATRTVIICDMAENFGVELVPGITPSWQKCTGTINDQEYKFLRVDKPALQTKSELESIGDLLIFYTAAANDAGVTNEDVVALKNFYSMAGGQSCPLIVVIRGCVSQQGAEICWNDVVTRHSDIKAIPTFLPSAPALQGGPKMDLIAMVERYCLDQVEVKSSRLHKVFKASKNFFVGATGSLFVRSQPADATVETMIKT